MEASQDHHLIARPNEYTAGAAHTPRVLSNCDITHQYLQYSGIVNKDP